MYTTATLTAGFGVPFLAIAARRGRGGGAPRRWASAPSSSACSRLRGELFGLLTLAVTFVLATIVLNTRIDGGPRRVPERGAAAPARRLADGHDLSPGPRARAWPVGDDRLCRRALAARARALRHPRRRGRRRGQGRAHASATSSWPSRSRRAIAGVAGGIHAMYVSYVTVGETFAITVPLYVVLMSMLGGARHWLGPAVGATIITASLYAFTGGQHGGPRTRGGGARADPRHPAAARRASSPPRLARWRRVRARWRRAMRRRRAASVAARPRLDLAAPASAGRRRWRSTAGRVDGVRRHPGAPGREPRASGPARSSGWSGPNGSARPR